MPGELINCRCKLISETFTGKYFVKTRKTKLVEFIKIYRTISRDRPAGLMASLLSRFIVDVSRFQFLFNGKLFVNTCRAKVVQFIKFYRMV